MLSFFAAVEACFVTLHVPCQNPPQMGFDFLDSVPVWSHSVCFPSVSLFSVSVSCMLSFHLSFVRSPFFCLCSRPAILTWLRSSLAWSVLELGGGDL